MSKPSLSYYADSIKPFFGIVEKIIDDTYVKVRCLGIHPLDKTDVPMQDLPPALVLFPTTGGQVSGGDISHNLEIDSWVMGYFMDYPFCMQPIVTNVIKGAAYSMSNQHTQGGEFVGQGSNEGYNNNDITPENSGSLNLPGNTTVEQSYNYVYSKLTAEGSSNDPHLHTSALIGVLLLETSGINPKTVGGHKGRAIGICQWLWPSRKQGLLNRYGDKWNQLHNQLDYMWWELNNTERNSKKMWLNSTNMPDAVAGFCLFEGAEEVTNGRVDRGHINFKRRLKYAYQTYSTMKYSGSRTESAQISSPQSRGDV